MINRVIGMNGFSSASKQLVLRLGGDTDATPVVYVETPDGAVTAAEVPAKITG